MFVFLIGVRHVVQRRLSPEQIQGALRWFVPRRRPITFAAVGAMFSVMGVGMVVYAHNVELVAVELAPLETEETELDAGYIEFSGFPRPEARICESARGGGEHCYTPITSSPSSRRVAMFISDEANIGESSSPWRGFVSAKTNPSFRAQVRELGFETSETINLLNTETREDRAFAGSIISLVGICLVLMGWFWLRRMS